MILKKIISDKRLAITSFANSAHAILKANVALEGEVQGFRFTRQRLFVGSDREQYSWIKVESNLPEKLLVKELTEYYEVMSLNMGEVFDENFEASLSVLEDANLQEINRAIRERNSIYSMVVNLTQRCNAKCPGCLAYIDMDKEMSLEELKDVLEILKKHDVRRVSFAGGEPLLRSDLIDIIRYAHELGFDTALNSNGILLNKAFINAVNGILNEIIIPYNGTREEISLPLNPYATKKHLELKEVMFKYILESSTIGLKVDVVVNKFNEDDLFNIIDKLASIGVVTFKMDRFYTVGENASFKGKYHLEDEEFDQLKVATINRYTGRALNILWGFDDNNDNNVFFISPSKKAISNRDNQNIVISPNYVSNYVDLHLHYGSKTPTSNYQIYSTKQEN